MSKKERGYLFSIRGDGSESCPFGIRKDTLIFGRDDHCDVRIYVDGVASKHCAIVFDKDGRAFLQPMQKQGMIFLNGEVIKRGTNLSHNDVFTIVTRSFKFCYVPSSKYYGSYPSAPCTEENMVYHSTDFISDEFCTEQKNKKRVTFGPSLSPEFFDKRLPPASPLQRGSLPETSPNSKILQPRLKNIKQSHKSVKDVKPLSPLSVLRNAPTTYGSSLRPEFSGKKLSPVSPLRRRSLPETSSNSEVLQPRLKNILQSHKSVKDVKRLSQSHKSVKGVHPLSPLSVLINAAATFGSSLSPEFSDKRSSPASPLQRESVPETSSNSEVLQPRLKNILQSHKSMKDVKPLSPLSVLINAAATFGSSLSPEFPDKRSPPASPLQRESLPETSSNSEVLQPHLKNIVESNKSVKDVKRLSQSYKSVKDVTRLSPLCVLADAAAKIHQSLGPEYFEKRLPPTSPSQRENQPETSSNSEILQPHLKNIVESNKSVKDVKPLSPVSTLRNASVVLERLPRSLSEGRIPDKANVSLEKSNLMFPEVITEHHHYKRLAVKENLIKFTPLHHQKETFQEKIIKTDLDGPSDLISAGSSKDYEESFNPPEFEWMEDKKPDYLSSGIGMTVKNSMENDNDSFIPCSRVSNVEGKVRMTCDLHVLSDNKDEEGQKNHREIISSTSSITMAENTSEENGENINNFVQNINTINHPNMFSNLNSVCLGMYVDAVRKLALTISLMSGFQIYSKIMEDVSNSCMNTPSTSVQSCQVIKDDHQNCSVHQNKTQMDISKSAWIQDIVQNFFSSHVGSNTFPVERSMLESDNLNYDCVSCPLKRSYNGSSLSMTNKVMRVEEKNKSNNLSKFNADFKQSCCCQDSFKPSVVQSINFSSPGTSFDSFSPSREHSSLLPFSSFENSSMQEVHDEGDIQICSVKFRKNTNNIANACFQYENVHKSFDDIPLNEKSEQVIRKSPSRCLKLGKLSNSSKVQRDEYSSITCSLNSNGRNLRPRNHVALKEKQRKVSLLVKKYRMSFARKAKNKIKEKENSPKSLMDFDVKLSEDLKINVIDVGQQTQSVKPKRVQRDKRKQEGNADICKRVTRAAGTKNKNVGTSLVQNASKSKTSFKNIDLQMQSVKSKKVQRGKRKEESNAGICKRVTRAARTKEMKSVKNASKSNNSLKRTENEITKKSRRCKNVDKYGPGKEITKQISRSKKVDKCDKSAQPNKAETPKRKRSSNRDISAKGKEVIPEKKKKKEEKISPPRRKAGRPKKKTKE